MKSPEQLFALFKTLNYEFQNHTHPAIFNAQDGETHAAVLEKIPGPQCKNLFLQDSKGKLYLVITLAGKRVDMKALTHKVDAGRLSFARTELINEILGVPPGSVTPFALINDNKHELTVILDGEMLQHEIVNFHPMVNTMTTTIKSKDLLSYISYCGHEYKILSL